MHQPVFLLLLAIGVALAPIANGNHKIFPYMREPYDRAYGDLGRQISFAFIKKSVLAPKPCKELCREIHPQYVSCKAPTCDLDSKGALHDTQDGGITNSFDLLVAGSSTFRNDPAYCYCRPTDTGDDYQDTFTILKQLFHYFDGKFRSLPEEIVVENKTAIDAQSWGQVNDLATQYSLVLKPMLQFVRTQAKTPFETQSEQAHRAVLQTFLSHLQRVSEPEYLSNLAERLKHLVDTMKVGIENKGDTEQARKDQLDHARALKAQYTDLGNALALLSRSTRITDAQNYLTHLLHHCMPPSERTHVCVVVEDTPTVRPAAPIPPTHQRTPPAVVSHQGSVTSPKSHGISAGSHVQGVAVPISTPSGNTVSPTPTTSSASDTSATQEGASESHAMHSVSIHMAALVLGYVGCIAVSIF